MNEKQGGSRFSLERGNEISNKYNINELINLLIISGILIGRKIRWKAYWSSSSSIWYRKYQSPVPLTL